MLPEGKNWPSPTALPTETGQAPPTADLRPTWSRARVASLLCWEQGRVGDLKRKASAGCLLGGQEGRCVPPLTPSPALRGGVGSIPLPTSPVATTPDLGYTEAPLLALKGLCVPLPARPPRASPPLRSRNTQPRPKDSQTHPPAGQKRPAPSALPGRCQRLPVCPEPWPGATGTEPLSVPT